MPRSGKQRASRQHESGQATKRGRHDVATTTGEHGGHGELLGWWKGHQPLSVNSPSLQKVTVDIPQRSDGHIPISHVSIPAQYKLWS